ncbi:MAG: hypothetical protein AVDCRST_MAG89-2695, partial [uncultured Gemmatimonadetes bacterium]
MRRIFALLLATPLLANCSPDSNAPLAASGAVHSEETMHDGAWPAEENWYTPEDVLTLVEDEPSVQTMAAPEGDLSTAAVGAAAAPAPGAV